MPIKARIQKSQTQARLNSLMSKSAPDLFEDLSPTPKNKRIYTVSQITQGIKLILENNFNDIWVEGELSGLTKTAKGIIFFSLKDNTSLLRCVMFNSSAAGVKFQLKDGMKLICFGRLSVYEKDGRYQLYVQEMEPKGIGSLQLALEQLKQKLEKEGLFRQERKRPIPYLPSTIGLVTSLEGAAVKDILKVLDRRFSGVHIIIKPAKVQGEGSKDEIVSAIEELNCFNDALPVSERIEVIIAGRGGGSVEDLWAFNEEIVARAIYNSKIPVISAVGHERDWTIADLVADLRAATPSVAAELVIPEKDELKEQLSDLSGRLGRSFLETIINSRQVIDDLMHRLNLSIEHRVELNINRLSAAGKKLSLLSPAAVIRQYKIKTIDLAKQIYVRVAHLVELRQSVFNKAIEKLSSLSPLNILSRGYSITFKMPENSLIKDAGPILEGCVIKTRVHKGEILSKVTEVNRDGRD